MTPADLAKLTNLDQPGRRVLVVEDYLPWLARLADYWLDAGQEVVAMTGVLSIESFIATGPGFYSSDTVTVDLRTVDAAFLDNYFVGGVYDGPKLTRELMLASSPRIVGMSSSAEKNRAMRRAGAVAAFQKSELMRTFS